MNLFVLYDTSGVILNQCASTMSREDIETHWYRGPNGDHEIAWIENALLDQHHYRVVSGSVVLREVMPASLDRTSIAADGVDTATISGIPEGAVATINGAVEAGPVEVTDGELAITSTSPGTIRVQITNDPVHVRWETTIDAT